MKVIIYGTEYKTERRMFEDNVTVLCGGQYGFQLYKKNGKYKITGCRNGLWGGQSEKLNSADFKNMRDAIGYYHQVVMQNNY